MARPFRVPVWDSGASAQPIRMPVVLQTSPPHPKSTRSMRMGGTPQGTIQVRRRGLVVARCGIGVADSFGMKQCRGGCPISDIAVLVDRQGLHEGDS
jgi:hypothetical protein